MPNFELLNERIASALYRTIHNPPFRRRVSLEEQKSPKTQFFRGRQIAYLIYEYFWVTGAIDSVENYADLLTMRLRNDDIQEFDSKWGGNSLIDGENPTWWFLGRIVQIKNTRVWETPDRIGIVWPGDYQKRLGPDFQRFKTMFKKKKKKRIVQDLRNRNFDAQNGYYEKRLGQECRGQNSVEQGTLGDRWQWETHLHCSKGDKCSFRHDVEKRAKMTQQNPSPNSFMQQSGGETSRTRSLRGKSQCWNVSMATQGLPQRNLHQFILWQVAPSRMLVLKDKERLEIWV